MKYNKDSNSIRESKNEIILVILMLLWKEKKEKILSIVLCKRVLSAVELS